MKMEENIFFKNIFQCKKKKKTFLKQNFPDFFLSENFFFFLENLTW